MPHRRKSNTFACFYQNSHTTHLLRPCFCKAEIHTNQTPNFDEIHEFLGDFEKSNLDVGRVVENLFRGGKGGAFVEFAASSAALHALPLLLLPFGSEPDTRRRCRIRDPGFLFLGLLAWPARHAHYAKTVQSHRVGHVWIRVNGGGGFGLFGNLDSQRYT